MLAPIAPGQQPAAPRALDLKASDGIVLKATYVAAAQRGPGVLLLHQCNRQREVWDDLAGQLSVAGIHVLTMDLRGFGESGGTPFDKMEPGWRTRESRLRNGPRTLTQPFSIWSRSQAFRRT